MDKVFGTSTEPPEKASVDFGFRRVAESEKQGMVDAVFHRVAERYDRMNDLMSLGMHRLWKDAMVNWLSPPRTGSKPYRVLDLAGGTGDIAFRIARRSAPAEITVADINASMLEVGRERAAQQGLGARVSFTEENAEALSFGDNRFDAATIAFGIRNVTHIDRAIAEVFRVLRPGGRFLVLEFSKVEMAGLDRLYDLYSFNVVPAMGKAVVGDGEPYRYLVESIRRFPNQARFAALMEAGGFERVEYRNFSGGIVALHSGWKF
jgi:demethylmenaquinone methyltransferase/2-methoxy-6-polyprenyl-1,4-benzoquinol methylase